MMKAALARSTSRLVDERTTAASSGHESMLRGLASVFTTARKAVNWARRYGS